MVKLTMTTFHLDYLPAVLFDEFKAFFNIYRLN